MTKTNKENICITKAVKTETQAVDGKMKALTYKLFGLINPMPYELISSRKVFIPYELLVFSYEIGEPSKGKKTGLFGKSGRIAMVFDVNEVHGYHFDLSEDLLFETLQAEDIDGEILHDQCSKQKVIESASDTIRFRYLNRNIGRKCALEVLERTKFYRPAIELTVMAHGKEMQRYAYLDRYDSSSENIRGLKVRLEI